MRSVVELVRFDLRHYGVWPAFHDVVVRVVNKLVVCKKLKVFQIDSIVPPLPELTAEYSIRFLTAEELRRHAKDRELDLSPQFVRDALARTMPCLGVYQGNTLASYSWYSTGPTEALDALVFTPPNDHVYLFKTFTRPAYRGQRLFAAGVSHALKHFQSQGFAGLVAYVESNNYASLAAFTGIGASPRGAVRLLRLWGSTFLYPSRATRRAGVSLRHI